jgi:hypothetical protein
MVTDRRVSGRAAGVYGWEEASEPSPFSETAFRWTKGRAAVREPVRGRVLSLPVYLARPDLDRHPVNLRVSVNGIVVPRATLTTNGWHVLSYDLVALLGPARWSELRAVSLRIEITPTVVPAEVGQSDDRRVLGVGIGGVRWAGPAPD